MISKQELESFTRRIDDHPRVLDEKCIDLTYREVLKVLAFAHSAIRDRELALIDPLKVRPPSFDAQVSLLIDIVRLRLGLLLLIAPEDRL